MEISDFLPKYPYIHESKYENLNPYPDSNFFDTLFHKKEFYENRLGKNEEFPKERGSLTKYQKTIARYLSSRTPYDRLLLIHSPGLGKTCSAVGAIEQIISEKGSGALASSYDGAIILAKNEGLLENFKNQLVEVCTAGYYIPENYKNLTDNEKTRRINKKTAFYNRETFAKFAKSIQKMTDIEISEQFSNKIIVIDEVHNIRIQDEDKEENVEETYTQIHRFLQNIKNSKVLLLSGTPMKDKVDELASIGNLLVSKKEQFPTGNEFINEYMDEVEGVFTLKKDKIKEVQDKLKGKISFLREAESSVKREYIGEKKYGGLKHFVVTPLKMSKFQTKHYEETFRDEKKSTLFTVQKDASLFVYPDGSYGKKGFEKYIVSSKSKKIKLKKGSSKTYKLSDTFINDLTEDGKDEKSILKRISKYSVIYAETLKHILNTNGNCFIYSSIVNGSGSILFSLLLEFLGYSKATGKETEKRLRYALLAGETVADSEIKRINKKFNEPENLHGDFIKVIIGSKKVSEGFSFKNVIFEAILTPHWNYSETSQALARGIRLGSHNDLIKNGETPVVKIFQPVSIPNLDKSEKIFSVDLHMYRLSEDKDISIKGILRLLMEISFDCALNYLQNYVDGEEGSRVCDYTKCDYTCSGIDMEHLDLDRKDLDYSTYQLYWSNPKVLSIGKEIEKLFRKKVVLSFESIVAGLAGQFTEEEISNALFLIQEKVKESDDNPDESYELDYKTFLDIYSKTPIKIMMNKIELLFKDGFIFNLDTIFSQFPDNTEFEVLTALRTMINENTVILNKYNIPSYLREQNNVFFLVNNLGINSGSNFFTNWYTSSPTLHIFKSAKDVLDSVAKMIYPEIVEKICKATSDSEFEKLIKTLPLQIQELFIEASILAKRRDINTDVKNRVISYFENYIKKVGDVDVSILLKEPLRCLKKGKLEWKDCGDEYKEAVKKLDKEKLENIRKDNPYGIMGTYNPENGSFCLVDISKQASVKDNEDKRLMISGKVCVAGGWKLDELTRIAVLKLSLDVPEEFKRDKEKDLRKKLLADADMIKIFSKETIEKANLSLLQKMLYWGTPKNQGGNKGIKPICEAIKDFLNEKGYLEIDTMCGVQGKKLYMDTDKKKEKGKKTYMFRVENYKGRDRRFREIVKDLEKVINGCFGTKKFNPPEDDNNWIIVYLKTKIVAVMMVDSKNTLHNVCVPQNYRRAGIHVASLKEATKKAMELSESVPTKPPILNLRKDDGNFEKLLRMYKSFGFTIIGSDKTFEKLTNLNS